MYSNWDTKLFSNHTNSSLIIPESNSSCCNDYKFNSSDFPNGHCDLEDGYDLFGNRINGQENFYNGIRAQAVNNSFFVCNDMHNIQTGFRFINPYLRMQNHFRANVFGTHENGLLLEENSFIGGQNNTGNRWFGEESDLEAHNLNINNTDLCLNNVDIATLGADYFPNPVNPK
ncbi:MAG: hypothetical protein ACI9XO_003309 [Paraglaciecola sp.]|jgi:hypothetical protein